MLRGPRSLEKRDAMSSSGDLLNGFPSERISREADRSRERLDENGNTWETMSRRSNKRRHVLKCIPLKLTIISHRYHALTSLTCNLTQPGHDGHASALSNFSQQKLGIHESCGRVDGEWDGRRIAGETEERCEDEAHCPRPNQGPLPASSVRVQTVAHGPRYPTLASNAPTEGWLLPQSISSPASRSFSPPTRLHPFVSGYPSSLPSRPSTAVSPVVSLLL